MNASKYIKLALVVVHCVTISDSRQLSIIFQTIEFEISQVEAPDIIQTIALIFSSKNVDISIVSCDRTTSSWTWHVFIRYILPAFAF